MPPHLVHLPPPPPEAQALSDQLSALIANEISASGCWISFARYMELALYAPGLGYYSAGSRKLGSDGDFVTAPEISPLFARCLARQLAELSQHGLNTILELGAGSGALAAELLLEMGKLGCAPDAYLILELSADLRERQRACVAERAPAQLTLVRWIDVLPAGFEGVMIANEVLDATPAHIVATCQGDTLEAYVQYLNESKSFSWYETRAPDEILRVSGSMNLPSDDYKTEINLTARALVSSLTRVLARGVALFIDYGFPAHEYYHPQRNRGTLMCHYRHHAHDDPFCLVGLQDITTHVDFSAIASAAQRAGAQLLGYTSQANFLINCGITDLLAATPASDARAYAPLASQVHKLTSPAEMGELFKVIALGKGMDAPLIGFARGDRSHTL
jgi:SAM-dependent MidA family methyltransferase